LINRRRRASNRLGFAVQLALLKFPGRTLMEVKKVPRPVLTAISEQVGVPASAFTSYGERENTLYEHLDELRRECGFRSCGWREYLLVARSLLPDAMESDRPLPLIETVLERLRTEGILAPNMIHIPPGCFSFTLHGRLRSTGPCGTCSLHVKGVNARPNGGHIPLSRGESRGIVDAHRVEKLSTPYVPRARENSPP
jgi:Domain of unknown function (DUF4158)